MEEIFRHRDGDRGEMRVISEPRSKCIVISNENNASKARAGVRLPESVARSLRDALTAWLGETIETISTPPSPDTELIERLVSQALTKVLPLHLAKAAVECGQCGAPWSDIHGYPGDPCVEPSAPVPLPARCGCGHFRRDHADECTVGECTCKLTWSQVQAYLSASAPAPKCTCVHPTADHHAPSSGWEGGCTGCMCQWPGVNS